MNSALTLGMRDLDWLEQNSEPAAQGDLDLVADAYKSYIRTLTDMVEVGRHRGDQRKLEQRGKMARLMADTLRQQLTTNIATGDSRRRSTCLKPKGSTRNSRWPV